MDIKITNSFCVRPVTSFKLCMFLRDAETLQQISTSKSSSTKRCNKSNVFQGISVTPRLSLILEDESPSLPHSLTPSQLRLIAVFFFFSLASAQTGLCFPHVFSTVSITLKWRASLSAYTRDCSQLDYSVILNLCLLGHICRVFYTSLCFEKVFQQNKGG